MTPMTGAEALLHPEIYQKIGASGYPSRRDGIEKMDYQHPENRPPVPDRPMTGAGSPLSHTEIYQKIDASGYHSRRHGIRSMDYRHPDNRPPLPDRPMTPMTGAEALLHPEIYQKIGARERNHEIRR